MGKLQVKRIYEAPEETDGSRVLVDRLWPRGIKKEKAELTAWEKAIAPTNELRKRSAMIRKSSRPSPRSMRTSWKRVRKVVPFWKK